MLPTNTTEFDHEYAGETLAVEFDKNESPINLFKIDYDLYPTAKHIGRHYSQELNAGDCIYIPSFHFYQIHGKAKVQIEKGDTKPSVIMLSI